MESLNFGEVQVQNFGTSRDVMIRVPIRDNVKQADVAPLVFDSAADIRSAALILSGRA